MKRKELITILRVPQEDQAQFDVIMEELINTNKIMQTKRGKYALPEKANMISGTFRGSARGFGFVVPDNGGADIYIAPKDVNKAMHKDTVLCKVTSGTVENVSGNVSGKLAGKLAGKIVKITSKENPLIVGKYTSIRKFGIVEPDDIKFGAEIYVKKQNEAGAKTGDKVMVEVIKRGDTHPHSDIKPEGVIKQIIGRDNDPGVDILSVCYEYNLSLDFPDDVMTAVKRVPATVRPADKVGRLDLRDLQMVTIDGEDAKDLDDAVSLEKIDNGNFRLGVHIADVTHYVKPTGAIGKEAFRRGTSVYLVDRVIPMLPHKLSNGICSLNEGQDRLALSCIMDIDQKGKVFSHEIVETLIKVDRRMCYTDVKKILEDKDKQTIEKYKELVPMFEEMEGLAQILRSKRNTRGALDFDVDESKVILDEKGKPIDIKAYERNVATKLIEEFMLVANETVAEEYYFRELPFVFRVHEDPDTSRINDIMSVISSFGHTLDTKQKVKPSEIQKLLLNVKSRPEEDIISKLVLRSLKQAKYNHECAGHFGLSARFYCHFTSPIRRYPDLEIHRIIKYNIHGKLKGAKLKNLYQEVAEVSKHSSFMERQAELAERETIKIKKAEFMEDKVGQSFYGIISGVTSWGLYITLPNTVEGLLPLNNMYDDYYIFDEPNFRYVGENLGKSYQIGQKVHVKVARVDHDTHSIDFDLID